MKIYSFICAVLISTSLFAAFSSVDPTRDIKLNDVLIVLDDSGSMQNFRKNISTKLVGLISDLNQERMQIGIVMSDKDSTDAAGSPFMGSFSRGDFAETMNVLERDINRLMTGNGTYSEVFYEAILRTFPNMTTSPFHRENAKLNIYIVTDEDQTEEDMSTLDFLTSLKSFKDLSDVVVNLITPTSSCRHENTGEVRNMILYKAAAFTGGDVYNLCNDELVRINL